MIFNEQELCRGFILRNDSFSSSFEDLEEVGFVAVCKENDAMQINWMNWWKILRGLDYRI